MIGIALALLAPQLGLGAVWTGLIGASVSLSEASLSGRQT
jgi:hypothetical protein